MDDLATGESWFTADLIAIDTVRYSEPIILTPLYGDEITFSDAEFKPIDFSLTSGAIQPQEQIDLHKANLISLFTNKSSRGSISPWEGSMELSQQIPATSIWLASLETMYEASPQTEVDSKAVRISPLARSWMFNEANASIDPIEDENASSIASSNVDVLQNPLGISTGIIASTSGSNPVQGEIISTSLRWIAMVFLAIVLLIPAGCSYAARLVGGPTPNRSSRSLRRRRRPNADAPSAISRAISNVATR